MKKVNISRADLEDAGEILELQKAAYQSEAQRYNDWTIPPLTQTLEETQNEIDSLVFLKATYQQRIIGSVRAFADGNTCFISRLFVHADFQRKGIGTRLMERIERLFPTVDRYELCTGDRSLKSIRFYHRLGYRKTETKKQTDKVDIVIMEKKAQKSTW
jgi:GNAT superfamily N-acetyltransferase